MNAHEKFRLHKLRIRLAHDRDQELNRAIGERIARDEPVSELEQERRELREEIESLHAATSPLEAMIRAAASKGGS